METITIEMVREYLKINTPGLQATQFAICLPVINRISHEMTHGIRFEEIKVCDNLIIDGHHRYVSALLANKPIGSVTTLKSSATIQYDWNEVAIVIEEWDTKEKIEKLNKDDAYFNKLTLSEIIRILE